MNFHQQWRLNFMIYGFFDMTKSILSEKKIYVNQISYEKIVKESKNQQKEFVSNSKYKKNVNLQQA